MTGHGSPRQPKPRLGKRFWLRPLGFFALCLVLMTVFLGICSPDGLAQQATDLRPIESPRPPSTLPFAQANQPSNSTGNAVAMPSAAMSSFVADGSAVNPADGSIKPLEPAANIPTVSPRPLRLKVTLGGEKPVRWEGHLRMQSPSSGTWNNLNLLSIEPKALGLVRLHNEPQEIQFQHTDAITYNTFQVDCSANLDAELELQLRSPDNPQWSFYQKLTLAQLIEAPWTLPLANSGHGIWIERPEYDQLLLESSIDKDIFEAGESFQITAVPNRLRVSRSTALKYHAQITELSNNKLVWEERGEVPLDQAGDHLPLKPFTVNAGPTPGVYQLQLELSAAKSPLTSLLPTNVMGNSVVASRQKQWVVGPSSWDRLTPVGTQLPSFDADLKKSNHATALEITASQLVSPAFRPFESQRLQLLQRLQPYQRPKDEPFATRSSETLRTTEANGKSSWELGKNQWRVIELPQLEAGAYWVEVEFEDSRIGPLELDVVQADRWGRVPHWTTGSLWRPVNDPLFPDVATRNNTAAKHQQWRTLHWLNPSESHPSTLLCLTNRNAEKTIRIATIRVTKHEVASTSTASTAVAGKRQVGYYLEAPLLSSIFAARKPAPTAAYPPLNDWLSYHDAVERLVEFLRAKNYNSVWVPVIKQGGTLFPLAEYQTLPRFENSSFGALSQSNPRMDVLELMLREFSREQMGLIPVLDFSVAFPTVSEGPVTLLGPLDPARQRQVLDIVQQMLRRYHHHAALQGVAIELNPESPLLFRSLGDGLTSDTAARFLADHSIEWPEPTLGSLADASPAVIENWILQNHLQRWLQWRATKLTEFFEQVQASLRVPERPNGGTNLTLHLVVANLHRHSIVQDQVFPSLRRQPNWPEHWLQLGLNLDQFQNSSAGPRLVLQQPSKHSIEMTKNRREIVTTRSPEFWQALSTISNLDFISQASLNHSTVDALSDKPSDHVGQSLLSFGVVSDGTGCEANWAEALRRQDVRSLLNQSGGLARSEQTREKEFASAFAHLSDQEFVSLFQDPSSPVAIRQSVGTGTSPQVYIVNAAPWPASCGIDATGLRGDQDLVWNNMVTNEPLRPAKLNPTDNRLQPASFKRSEATIRLTLELAPYSLTVLEGPPIAISQVHVQESSGEVIDRLQELKASLFRRLRQATTNATPLDSIRNAGFEEALRQPLANSPGNWSHGPLKEGQQIDQDLRTAHSGTSSLRVRNSEGILWLRSNPIPPPTTGRLSVTAWIRANPQQPLPSLRLAIDGQGSDEKKYYRFAEIPLDQPAVAGNENPGGEWRPIAVHFDDIPETGLNGLRIGFDVLKSGEIWIDSIQCFDRWLDANDQNVLSNRLGLVAFSLDTKQNSWAALQSLDDYWLRFLVAYVPDPNQVADATPSLKQSTSEMPIRGARGARRFLPLR